MPDEIYPFPGSAQADISQVGGKGLSLILGSNMGFPVPDGFILSVTYFADWLHSLKKTKEWEKFLTASDAQLPVACNNLKKTARAYALSVQQRDLLDNALKPFGNNNLFAVRSSSPSEDLEGNSFAGGYETILGARRDHLASAIVTAFCSCLDYRVVVYKKENDFSLSDPKIAVIIQRQIACDIAGVGFSINPVTNNFDEAIFNANFGVGETVVSGSVTPDTYTVNKVSMQVIDKIIGSKKLGIFVKPSGGTEKKKIINQSTLSDAQVHTLTVLIKKVEEFYQKPIDIE
jgi:rifampicin phosphotransferase